MRSHQHSYGTSVAMTEDGSMAAAAAAWGAETCSWSSAASSGSNSWLTHYDDK
jgi:hypothetical protein